MKRLRAAGVMLPLACMLFAAGCASSRASTVQERVGGVLRTRKNITAEAYEAVLRGELAVARNNLEDALSWLNRALEFDPGDPGIRARLVEVHLLAGHTQEAAALAVKLTTDAPLQASSWIALALTRAALHDSPGTNAALLHAQQQAPDDPEVTAAAVQLSGGNAEDILRAVRALKNVTAAEQSSFEIATLEPTTLLRDGGVIPRGISWRSLRRARAQTAFAAELFAEVDAWIAPSVAHDTLGENLNDRVMLIEARARDGRASDAAALVAGLPVGTSTSTVTVAEHARLWLLVNRPELAREECDRALVEHPDDLRLARFMAEALFMLHRPGEALASLATIDRTSALFTDVRVLSVRVLWSMNRADLASRVAEDTLTKIDTADARGRDRLRVEMAENARAAQQHETFSHWLSLVETPWGRQQRGRLTALDAAELSDTVIADLRARTGEPDDDARADATFVVACVLARSHCAESDVRTALSNARALLPGAPITMLALSASLLATDATAARDWFDQALARAPRDLWNARLGARIADVAGAAHPDL